MDDATTGMTGQIEHFAWADTPVGERASWPPVLQLIVDVMLASRFPMCVFWGPDLVQIYNDGYVPLFGARHPKALGQPARDCWPEVWDTVGPLLHGALDTGEPVWREDMPFTLLRNGFPEVAYFTFCYSRIGADPGERGVLCINVETTKPVLRELEFRAMADNLANIIYSHASDGTMEWANRRWFEYTRLSEPMSRTIAGWKEIVPADDLALIRGKSAYAFANGEAYEAEIRIKPYGESDEAYRWHLVRAVPMRGPGGEIVRWAGSATDVHGRRVAEKALRERLERDLDREHQASLAFQRAALPQTLPEVPGLTFDAMYEAAGEDALVGGDWYDTFRLADGRVVLSVGDVIGSGLAAAVTMVAVRQAIRGAAQVFPEPVAVLDAADRALRSEQPDRIVTAFLGIYDPLTRMLSYASAGHPPPFVRTADGQVVELTSPDLPLGLRDDKTTAVNRTFVLPEGALLVLYTDGLTEATHDVLEGERRLRDAIATDAVYAAHHPAAAIRERVLAEAADDVAILTVRVGARSERVRHWTFDSDDAETGTRVRRELASILRAAGASASEAADAELVFGELLGNVVRHTAGDAEAALDMTDADPVLHVLDRGTGFTYYARLPTDNMSESGRGLYIAAMLARDVSVVPRPEGGSHARAVLAVRGRRG
jgi:PAS domain-containing protein/anti-sigma regulatory factor (Ser/Thr protein kinase)